MNEPIITILNVQNGQLEERVMNVEEKTQFEKDQLDAQKEIEAKMQEELKKKALLDRLGITADEAKLLLK